MARLYSNENFPLRVVVCLRSHGHDVLTSLESGRANQKVPDDEVLRYAIEQQRTLLTLNRLDFFRLHRSSEGLHSGIIACTSDGDPVRLAQRIHDAIDGLDDLSGQLIRITRPQG
ncbi:hypothetical protein EI77_02808 [Prosthecobacter fusiformis]|uniref:DUF5615 domain-containing protein n=1 Tax=Prosthecobacter fusiformis TaxID=48464 RepID=A0A4R7RXZ0_9BACT|nr:DUF5615 family PIN-like protein [Prosthecobacter fusiformis]TDU70760.1 hypothetical protein EI77_02808 [Prosthecobacter fusiformis]